MHSYSKIKLAYIAKLFTYFYMRMYGYCKFNTESPCTPFTQFSPLLASYIVYLSKLHVLVHYY